MGEKLISVFFLVAHSLVFSHSATTPVRSIGAIVPVIF